jgi:hypothetical protein
MCSLVVRDSLGIKEIYTHSLLAKTGDWSTIRAHSHSRERRGEKTTEDVMKAFSIVNKRSMVSAGVLVCLVVAGSLSALAVPPSQVARIMTGQTIAAKCCVPFGPTVRVTEPITVAPVIVTWSSDYILGNTVQFALSVNGGPCLFYGSSVAVEPVLPAGTVSAFISGTFQWIVFPSDGLVKGPNTFTVCGGGVGNPVTMNIGFDTLTVQISK